jgi:hypothetical protein
LVANETLFARRFPERLFDAKQFTHGDVCAGVVVGNNQVAVYTDLRLSADKPSVPVIKIVGEPLDQLASGHPPSGTRLATCAYYYAGSSKNRWATFDPIVVDLVTDDAAAISDLKSSLSSEYWERLATLLTSCPLPFEEDVQFVFSPDDRLHHQELHPMRFPQPAARLSGAPLSVHRGSVPLLLWFFGVFILSSALAFGDGVLKHHVETWPAVVLALSLLAFVAAAAWMRRTFYVELYDDGFRWRDKAGTHAARWCDVASYGVETKASDSYGAAERYVQKWMSGKVKWRFSTATGLTTLVVSTYDGRTARLPSVYARTFKLYNKIIDRIDPYVLEEARKRLRHGIAMDFGNMLFDGAELRWGNERFPLNALDHASVVDGILTLRLEGQKAQRFPVDNAYALDALLREHPRPAQ